MKSIIQYINESRQDKGTTFNQTNVNNISNMETREEIERFLKSKHYVRRNDSKTHITYVNTDKKDHEDFISCDFKDGKLIKVIGWGEEV